MSASRAMSLASEAMSEVDPTIARASFFNVDSCRLSVSCLIAPRDSLDEAEPPAGGSCFKRGDVRGSCLLSRQGNSAPSEGFQFDECLIAESQSAAYEAIRGATSSFIHGFSTAVVLYGPSRGGKTSSLLSNALPLNPSGRGIIGDGPGSAPVRKKNVAQKREAAQEPEKLGESAGMLPRAVFDTLSFLQSQPKGRDGATLGLFVSIMIVTDKEVFDLLSTNTTDSKTPLLMVKEQQWPRVGGAGAVAWVPQNVEKAHISSLGMFATEVLRADKRRRTQLKHLLFARVNYVVQLTLGEVSQTTPPRHTPKSSSSRLVFVEMASNEKFRDAIDLEGDVKTSSILDPTPSLFKNGSLLEPATAMRVFQGVTAVRRYFQGASRAWGDRATRENEENVAGESVPIPNAPNTLIGRLLEYFVRGSGVLERANPTFVFFLLCCREGMPFESACRSLREISCVKGVVYSPSTPLPMPSDVSQEALETLKRKYSTQRSRSIETPSVPASSGASPRGFARKPSNVRRTKSDLSGDLARNESKGSVADLDSARPKLSPPEKKAIQPKPPAPRGSDADSQKTSPRDSPKEARTTSIALPLIRQTPVSKSSPPTPRPVHRLPKNENAATPRPAVVLPPISPRGNTSKTAVSGMVPSPPSTKLKAVSPAVPGASRPKKPEQPAKTRKSSGPPAAECEVRGSRESQSKVSLPSDSQLLPLAAPAVTHGPAFGPSENLNLLPLLRVVGDVQASIAFYNANGRFSDTELKQVQDWSALIDRVKLVASRMVESVVCGMNPSALPHLCSNGVSSAPKTIVTLLSTAREGPHGGLDEALLNAFDECLEFESNEGMVPSYSGGLHGEELRANLEKSKQLKGSTSTLLREFYAKESRSSHALEDSSEISEYFKEAFASYLLEGDGLMGNRRLLKALLIASGFNLIIDPDTNNPLRLREVCEERYLYAAAVSDGSVDYIAPLFSQYDSAGTVVPNVDLADVLTSAMYQQQYRIPLVERLCDVLSGIPSMVALLIEEKEAIDPAWQEFFHDICSAKKAINRENRVNRLSLIKKMICPPWPSWPFSPSDLQLNLVWTDGHDVLSRAARDNDVELLSLLRIHLSDSSVFPATFETDEERETVCDLIGRPPSNMFEQLIARQCNDFTPLLTAVFYDAGAAVEYIISTVCDLFGVEVVRAVIAVETSNGTALSIAKGLQRDRSIVEALEKASS